VVALTFISNDGRFLEFELNESWSLLIGCFVVWGVFVEKSLQGKNFARKKWSFIGKLEN
jgi:hypothetical protein